MDDKEKTLYASGKEACDHLDALCSRIRELANSARGLIYGIGICPLEIRIDACAILAATVKELESLHRIAENAWYLDRHELLRRLSIDPDYTPNPDIKHVSHVHPIRDSDPRRVTQVQVVDGLSGDVGRDVLNVGHAVSKRHTDVAVGERDWRD